MVSIIIRTKNEERWIVPCLRAIKRQTFQDYEIVLVDNNSTDKTVEKALQEVPDICLVTVDRFRPGLAINEGIRASSGDFLVCLSAHCVPTDSNWLKKLYENVQDERIAGVYGRQIPVSFSSPANKRDLLVTFGLDKRIQEKDSFFHNANSMFRRDVWKKHPFDEIVTNIEDRVWGKDVINAGYRIVYEPEACVYHHHGIHQDNKKDRLKGIVKIMEDLDLEPGAFKNNPLALDNLNIIALIPVKGIKGLSDGDMKFLLKRTVEQARQSKYIADVIVVPDSQSMARMAQSLGARVPFMRSISHSRKKIRLDKVLQFSLGKLEESGCFPDLVVSLEVTYPFRTKDIIDRAIEQVVSQGADTVMAGIEEYRPCWIMHEEKIENIIEYTRHRDEREPIHIGLIGVVCVTYPEIMRKSGRIGDKLGICKIMDPFAGIEVRNKQDFTFALKHFS